ncbi:MAG TPA: hypothetical protein VK864_12135 [Longimicrobiales bacterium]|nr:hypothetical protein [Longimicrobiales bacterium]
MRARFVLAVTAALLAVPAPAAAAGPQDASSPAYAREERALGGGARLILESVVIEGTALTDAIREATDLASLAGANVSRVQGQAGAVQFKTIGRRMTAVNQLGWVVAHLAALVCTVALVGFVAWAGYAATLVVLGGIVERCHQDLVAERAAGHAAPWPADCTNSPPGR